MSAELARVLERLRQNRAARTATRTIDAGARPGNTGAGGSTFPAGSRAFDTVSGQHVEVVGGATENIIVPAPERAAS